MQFPERMRKTNNLCSSRVTNLIIALIIHRVCQKRIARIPLRFNTAIAFLSTVERGCSGGCGGGGGVGAFRECRRLRLMLFTQSPGYLAFLQHDWLLPRAPVRSLVLSSGIVGAPSSPRQRFLYNAPPIVRYLRVRENSRRHSSARWFATTVCQRRGPSFVASLTLGASGSYIPETKSFPLNRGQWIGGMVATTWMQNLRSF